MNSQQELKFNDIHAKAGVKIQIRHDGLIIWINVDGICVTRILTDGLTVPIDILDFRDFREILK
jgi:hypothetical protein